MEYAGDTSFMIMVLLVPSLFGISLLGEGVSKIMNYDQRGWFGIAVGCAFLVVLVFMYLVMKGGGGF